MPEGMTPPPGGMSPQPGAPPAGGASPQGQASGPGGASMPTPNRGIEGQAMALLAGAAQFLQNMVLPKIPITADASEDVRKAIGMLTKHISPAEQDQGVMSSGMKQVAMQQRQMGPQIAAARMAQPGGQSPQPSPPPTAM